MGASVFGIVRLVFNALKINKERKFNIKSDGNRIMISGVIKLSRNDFNIWSNNAVTLKMALINNLGYNDTFGYIYMEVRWYPNRCMNILLLFFSQKYRPT